jgi:predicted restriction endonuclease
MKEITCLNCGSKVWKQEHRQKFCSMTCAGIYTNAHRKLSDIAKQNMRDGNKKFWDEHPEMRLQNGIESSKGRYKSNLKSILDVSKRTAHKILKRMDIGCCVCGWKDAACDIHHINGKKVKNCDGHWNLTLLCPNHHRMIHSKKISISDIKTMDEHFPKNWNEYYYG